MVKSDLTRGDKDSCLVKELNSLQFSFGDIPNKSLDIHNMEMTEVADDIRKAFAQTRKWGVQNEFISTINMLWCAFFSYKLSLKAVDKKNAKKLKDYLAIPRNALAINRFVRESIMEWRLNDNILTFWRDKQDPFLLMPEDCRYTDAMGEEKLYVRLHYKDADLQGLTPDEIKRYASKEILLRDPKCPALSNSENFLVCTRGLRGRGLGWPTMMSVFRTASQHESMQVGEAQYAIASRLVTEMHSIGFEAKSTSSAHKQADYLFKKARAAAIMKSFGGATGLYRFIAQFDHAIKYVWAGANKDAWDSRKWDTSYKRLMWWGGPLAYMMESKSVSPFLLQMLGQQITYDRTLFVGPYLATVLSETMLPKGCAVELVWGDQVFQDPRLAWQIVKDLMQQGPLSLHTALEQGGFDPDKESELKKSEAKESRTDELVPKFDPNHGNRPGQNTGKAGRKPGTKDGDGE